MTSASEPVTASYPAADGNVLSGDAWGDQPFAVVLLHGGGQTRHAWGRTAQRFHECGLSVVSLDLRGHGDSSWDSAGRYSYPDHVADLEAILRGHPVPVILVGASLGGVVSLIASRDLGERVRAIVLVDVTPHMQPKGIERIMNFMRDRPDGFDDLDQARQAIMAYQPHRSRQASEAGMRRNLRQRADGKWIWHWDPNTINFATGAWMNRQRDAMESAARAFAGPILLVRGADSDVVTVQDAGLLLALNPRARRIDVPGARHMVAGDENEIFCNTILTALAEAGVIDTRAEATKECHDAVEPR